MKGNKALNVVLGGVFALGLAGGGLALAQSAGAAPAAAQTTTAALNVLDIGPLGHRGGIGGLNDRDQALADALGIDLETLQTAHETARLAMIDQAVADGLITEAQAEQLKLYSGFGRGPFGLGAYDEDQYLADALGITVDKLDAAELTAFETELTAAVEAGYLTQDQANLMLAERVARSYLDTDAIEAQVQSAQEAAVAAALADGAITQAQADALLAQLAANPYHFGGGFGGFGGHGGRGGHGGPDGMRGFGLEQLPGSTTPDATPDTTTPDTTNTAFDA